MDEKELLKHKPLFDFNNELRTLIDPKLDHQPLPQDLKEALVVFTLGKAHKTQRAILLLCKEGYGQDAAVLTRTIFELAITTHYILQDKTDVTVERYFTYDAIIKEKLYQYAISKEDTKKGLEERIALGKTGDNSIEDVLKEANDFRDKYGKKKLWKGWSGKSIREMAEAVGRADAYDTVYQLQCNLAHSAITSANDYVEEGGGDLEIDATPSDKWVGQSLVATFDFFWHIIQAWNEVFTIGLEKELNELANRYAETVKNIKDD